MSLASEETPKQKATERQLVIHHATVGSDETAEASRCYS